MAFAGFTDPAGTFFKQLAKNQTREWFTAHKERYEQEWAEPFLELLGDVAAGIDSAYPYCEIEAPKVFRIYRDVRFAKDKTPYKTTIGGTLSIKGAGGVMDKPVALYLQLGTEQLAGAGHYMMPPAKLAKVRQAIVDPERGKELAKITKALAKRGFTFDAGEKLVRVPKGFDPDHPLADFLRMKGLVAMFPPLPPIGDASFAKWLRKECIAVASLVTWTTYAGS
jgi:uncharacterized protein (TIGR02453 family)